MANKKAVKERIQNIVETVFVEQVLLRTKAEASLNGLKSNPHI
jgi:hypothetical protein